MLDERSKIIIEEIKFWKEHKILPESYCDYLINLYSKGEPVERGENKSLRSGGQPLLLIQLSLITLMIPFSFLVIYFTEFHPLMQTGILSLFIAYALWLFYDLKKHQIKWLYVPLLALLFLILFSTEYIGQLIITDHWVSGIIIVLNFSAWYILGKKTKLKYVKYSGIIGLLMTCIYFVYNFSHVVL
ncbi:MAG TPA: hypothetical protein VIG73_15465 [Cerasibacillus sp.]|uniref:hypothetical protein n=1 Tax=Cerasibacillus sp. TaxID=2498711 RepID=UPI002F40A636